MPIFKVGDEVTAKKEDHWELQSIYSVKHIISPDTEHATLVCTCGDGDSYYFKLSEVDLYSVVNRVEEDSFAIREQQTEEKKHSHYYKDVSHLEFIDVYRVIDLFEVSNPCIQHAIKKLLVSGGRGGGKDTTKDWQEAIDSVNRAIEMKEEDE